MILQHSLSLAPVINYNRLTLPISKCCFPSFTVAYFLLAFLRCSLLYNIINTVIAKHERDSKPELHTQAVNVPAFNPKYVRSLFLCVKSFHLYLFRKRRTQRVLCHVNPILIDNYSTLKYKLKITSRISWNQYSSCFRS